MQATIAEIIGDFPSFRVAVIVADEMTVVEARPAELESLVANTEAQILATYSGTALSEIAGVRDWREAYRRFGIKKTSYRCSVERLIKNSLAGRPMPRINSFVDAYNAISLKHILPAGADDLDKVVGDIAFRYARPGDRFVRLGDETAREDPPKSGEVVYADDAKVLCRRWNWSQHAQSPVTTTTTRAVVTVQSLGASPLGPAIVELSSLLNDVCGAECMMTILDSELTAGSIVENRQETV
ncbi:MAG: hypothetical protein GY789_11050 [Hyphomicrobiales bacterium]|nr:hypothetical protein [Hyphomicrobiales bacterium]